MDENLPQQNIPATGSPPPQQPTEQPVQPPAEPPQQPLAEAPPPQTKSWLKYGLIGLAIVVIIALIAVLAPRFLSSRKKMPIQRTSNETQTRKNLAQTPTVEKCKKTLEEVEFVEFEQLIGPSKPATRVGWCILENEDNYTIEYPDDWFVYLGVDITNIDRETERRIRKEAGKQTLTIEEGEKIQSPLIGKIKITIDRCQEKALELSFITIKSSCFPLVEPPFVESPIREEDVKDVVVNGIKGLRWEPTGLLVGLRAYYLRNNEGEIFGITCDSLHTTAPPPWDLCEQVVNTFKFL